MIDVREGDALEVLRTLPDHSAHALVTDPPAGISFMGKTWDGDRGGRDQWIAWLAEILAECRRVLRPGAHALVWALPRTAHWTATALEDAGFEVRDVVVHLFGSGWPKSLDVSKAIDKAAGAEREVTGTKVGRPGYSLAQCAHPAGVALTASVDGSLRNPAAECAITSPATDAARQWQGWGTALKPGAEHWILARVPLAGTVAANVLEHGCGALNIDGCRIDPGSVVPGGGGFVGGATSRQEGWRRPSHVDGYAGPPHTLGRWPANVVISGDAPALLDAQSGLSKAGTAVMRNGGGARIGYGSEGKSGNRPQVDQTYGDFGGASRFFYCAKASRSERGEDNRHPTVKALELVRWLVRLITPPGGTVLDPFAGSGTTGVACLAEGFAALLIEREADYAHIARERVARASPLFHAAPLREGAR